MLNIQFRKQCVKRILIFCLPLTFTLFAQGSIKFERLDSMIGKQRDQALQSWNGFSSKVIYGYNKGEIEPYCYSKTVIFDKTSSYLYLFLSWSPCKYVPQDSLEWIIADAIVVKNYSLSFHRSSGLCSCKGLNKGEIYPIIKSIRPNSVLASRLRGYFHFDYTQKQIVYIKFSKKCRLITL